MRFKLRIVSLFTVISLCFGITVFSLPDKRREFNDIKNHWSQSIVNKLVDYGVVNGYQDNSFHPDAQISTDEFLKMIMVALGEEILQGDRYWAENYISKAIEMGMIEQGEYLSYSTPITRERMAKIVSHALKNIDDKNLSEIKAVIYDYAEISEEYKEYVLIAYNERIITGYENEQFRPHSSVTRAEAAATIIRLIDRNGGISFPAIASVNNTGGGQQGSKAAAALYVAANGNDSNDGSEGAPFKTIHKAREAVSSMIGSGNYPDGGVTVYLREGTHYIYDSIEFGPENSGKDNGKIVFTSYPGESARLSGNVPIDKSWFKPLDDTDKAKIIDKNAASKVLVADLRGNGVTEYGKLNTRGYHYFNKGQYMAAELIVNGDKQTLARYPNTGTISVNDEDLILDDVAFKYQDSRPSQWAEAEDVWICGTLAINYENNYYPVKEINPATKTITLKEGKVRSYYTNGWFFAENLLAEIDTQGEYYIDRNEGKLYYLPPTDFQSGNYTIELSTLEKPMFYFNGAKNISVENITMDGGRGYAALGTTHNYKMLSYGDFLSINNVTNPIVFDTVTKNATKLADPKEFPEAQVIPGHVWDGFLDEGDGVSNIEFKNCEIRNFGQGGLIFRGSDVKFNNNHIKNIGGTGIFISGGDLETLEPSGNEIKNNLIHNIGYQHKAYHPGVAINGVGTHMANNELYDAPHCVLNYHGNDHIIEYNKIHDVVKECLDMDAIYTRNEYIPQWRGSVVRKNYIYNLGIFPVGEYEQQLNISGIRTDNSGHALQIYNNIFANIGMSGSNSVIGITGQGGNNKIIGNLFVDCATTYRGADTFTMGGSWDMSNATVKERVELAKKYSQIPIFAEKYPELATFDKEYILSVPTNIFSDNLVVNIKFKPSETNGKPNADSTRGAPELIISKDNSVISADPGFKNYSSGNYEISDDSEILKNLPNYQNFKMSEFGPQITPGPAK